MRFLRLAAPAFAALAIAPQAVAHSVGVSRGDFTLEGSTLTAELAFARTELIGSLDGLDKNSDGHLDETELEAARATIDEKIVRAISVSTSSVACPGKLESTALAEEDGLIVRASFACTTRGGLLAVKLGFVRAMSHGHRHLATATAGTAIAHVVAYGDNDEMRLTVPIDSMPAAPAGGAMSLGDAFARGFVRMITGWEQLLLLLGLLLAGGARRDLLASAGAFAAGHSITLGLGAAGLFSPSPEFITGAIAVTIGYVGIENFFVSGSTRRWIVAFPFGLIHGYAIGRALGDAGGLALPAFHLGVELAFVPIAALGVFAFGKYPELARSRGARTVSAMLVLAAIYRLVG